jgi:hypothetical protein
LEIQFVLVRRLELKRVTLSLLLTLLATLSVVLVSWSVQELGLSFLTLLVLGSLMPILWEWALEKRLAQIEVIRSDSVREWVLEQRRYSTEATRQ